MLPSIKRRLAALGPAAIPFADTTPGIWLLETHRPAAPVAPAAPAERAYPCGAVRNQTASNSAAASTHASVDAASVAASGRRTFST